MTLASRLPAFTFSLVLLGAISASYAAPTINETAPPVGTNPLDRFAIQTWRTEEGLPQNTATAILQSRSGYVWAGTYNGLARFDGIRFTVFDSSNSKGLPNSRITALYEDRAGVLWIGHDTGQITKYQDRIFRPTEVNAEWSDGAISGFGEDSAGHLWAVSLKGKALRLNDGLALEPPAAMAADRSVAPQLVIDRARNLMLVRNGRIAALTQEGFIPQVLPGATAETYFSRIASARGGGWWVAGEGRMRRWFQDNWVEDLGEEPWGTSFVMCMMETSTGMLLVGTLDKGLFLYSNQTGWMALDGRHGLENDWIRCMVEDHEQNIWLGTGGGLVILRPRKVIMHGPPEGWNGKPVQAITPSRDGSVWAATEGAGLYRLKDSAWTHFGSAQGLSNLFTWSVLEDSEGFVWAGTWGGGLFKLIDGRFERQFDLAENGEPVTALLEHPKGVLWVGTTAGLMRVLLKEAKLERLSALGGAAAGDVRALAPCAGSDGIWIGAQGQGMGRLEHGKLQSYGKENGLPRDYVLALHEEKDGTLWIAIQDDGICRLRDGHFVSITTANGLPHNTVGHIAEDGLGNLWFSSQGGIFKVSKADLNACAEGRLRTLRPQVFGKAEGMNTLACSSGFTPSGFRSPDGNLWFPTAEGVAIVNPSTARPNPHAPRVLVEQVLVNGLPTHIPSGQASGESRDELARRAIRLKPSERQLDITFTGISLTSPERVLFRYMLAGLDRDWSQPGFGRRVTYPFLPPGHYTFRVTAGNSDGVWNEYGDAVDIRVLPWFWQTLWFKGLLALLSGGFVAALVWAGSRRRHKLKLERIARERELERERARIAQDIHDDLGASLTRIGMLSQSAAGDLQDQTRAAAQLNAIYDTARSLTLAMDEIVWAVNPRHDTLESLVNYITRFAYDFLSSANIRCRIDAAMTFPEVEVHSEVRHNLFLAFKETLNNIVKHAQATEVRVAMDLLGDRLKLSVSDNGQGFVPGKSANTVPGGRVVSGYGMQSINSRLEQIGGTLALETGPGRGTLVTFTVPFRSRPAPAQTMLQQ